MHFDFGGFVYGWSIFDDIVTSLDIEMPDGDYRVVYGGFKTKLS